jgi:membrane protein implicated in regulation of membrane protease activity
MTDSPDRLLRAIRITRGLLLFSLIAAAMLVAAAVAAGAQGGLALAAKGACLWAALVAAALMVLNLAALRAWRRARRPRATD